ncbi:MAG: Kelch repeat-containing protein [Thermoplasmatota archaeon]
MTKVAVLLIVPFLLLLMVSSGYSHGAENGTFGVVVRVGDMVIPRYNHTATLLDDGMVLATGGTADGYGSMRECEIFDPVLQWALIEPMSQERMRHDAALIPGTDDVIVTGGYVGGGHPSLLMHFNGPGNMSLASSEVYDTAASRWSPGPDLITGRFWHRSALTDRGELVVIGGLNVSMGALSSCEVYRNGRWEEFPPLPVPLARFSIVKLNDGSILVAGGHNGTSKTASARCFRLSGDVWTEVAPMNRGRGYFSGSLLEDGRYLVTGGFSSPGQPDWSDGEVYYPASDSWSHVSSMAFPRHNHATVPAGRYIAVVGGSNCLTGGCHSGIELYDVDEDEWSDSFHVVLGRKWAEATVMKNGSVLINGGKSCDESAARTELFIPPGGEDDNDLSIDVTGATVSMLILGATALIWTLSYLPAVNRRTGGKLKHSMPHFGTLSMGAVVMFLAEPLMLPLYGLIVVFTTIWFWANVCTHCYGWGSRACPSGYGMLSARLFSKAERPDFRRAFYMNVWSVALQWFVPLGVGITYLIMDLDIVLLLALVLFVVVGFLILPMTSRHKGCSKCPQRKDCPFRGS